ncbi:hypothetical protein ColTof4_07923 [Colletotrichum tofieldiae]|nr:hypothetical protein ColTof4_07923 [Colletotrichum tofieldiae]GKT83169.1 hypothetical protein Ct61P_01019 [Colletotrichum tofieldiae]
MPRDSETEGWSQTLLSLEAIACHSLIAPGFNTRSDRQMSDANRRTAKPRFSTYSNLRPGQDDTIEPLAGTLP